MYSKLLGTIKRSNFNVKYIVQWQLNYKYNALEGGLAHFNKGSKKFEIFKKVSSKDSTNRK